MATMYDGPVDTALRLENHGSATPDTMARHILDAFDNLSTSTASYGRQTHWGDYYSKAKVPVAPSPFAREVGKQLNAASRLLEVGCGNGRDSAFFWSEGHRVVALDASEAAVELARTAHGSTGIDFHHGPLVRVSAHLYTQASEGDALAAKLHALGVVPRAL